MTTPMYPYQQPRKDNTLIIAVVVIVAVVLVGTILAVGFYAPAILQSSSGVSNTVQDSSVTSATMTCTGSCDLSAHFSDSTGQSRQIAQTGPGVWMLDRPSSAYNWQVDWQVTLGSFGSVAITLNTGRTLLQLQGPSSNQGSWSTSSGQY